MLKIIKQSWVLKCPWCILMPEHYFKNGKCRCWDKEHVEMIEWGYKWNGEQWVADDQEEIN